MERLASSLAKSSTSDSSFSFIRSNECNTLIVELCLASEMEKVKFNSWQNAVPQNIIHTQLNKIPFNPPISTWSASSFESRRAAIAAAFNFFFPSFVLGAGFGFSANQQYRNFRNQTAKNEWTAIICKINDKRKVPLRLGVFEPESFGRSLFNLFGGILRASRFVQDLTGETLLLRARSLSWKGKRTSDFGNSLG